MTLLTQSMQPLLDEGEYLCSISTMYRILREYDEVRERRNQRKLPIYTKPELLATGAKPTVVLGYLLAQRPCAWNLLLSICHSRCF